MWLTAPHLYKNVAWPIKVFDIRRTSDWYRSMTVAASVSQENFNSLVIHMYFSSTNIIYKRHTQIHLHITCIPVQKKVAPNFCVAMITTALSLAKIRSWDVTSQICTHMCSDWVKICRNCHFIQKNRYISLFPFPHSTMVSVPMRAVGIHRVEKRECTGVCGVFMRNRRLKEEAR
jgi:hypothetical protein